MILKHPRSGERTTDHTAGRRSCALFLQEGDPDFRNSGLARWKAKGELVRAWPAAPGDGQLPRLSPRGAAEPATWERLADYCLTRGVRDYTARRIPARKNEQPRTTAFPLRWPLRIRGVGVFSPIFFFSFLNLSSGTSIPSTRKSSSRCPAGTVASEQRLLLCLTTAASTSTAQHQCPRKHKRSPP